MFELRIAQLRASSYLRKSTQGYESVRKASVDI